MTPKKIAGQADNPLQNFNPYSLLIEKKAIDRWYLPAFAPFVLAKLIAIPLYFSNQRDSFLNPGEDAIYLSVPIALSLTVLFYRAWTKQIPNVFTRIKNQLIRQPRRDATPKSYDQFLKKYLTSLHSGARYIIVLAVIASLSYILINMFSIPNDIATNIKSITLQDNLAFFKIAYVAVFYFISPLIWAYLVAIGAWIMGVTGWYLWKLPRDFEIKVETRHPDKCGGLGFLGTFCLSFSYPILISTIFLAILGLTGKMAGFHVSSAISGGAIFALIVFAMPLLYIAFFVPVWGIHIEMVLRGKEFSDIGAKYIKQLEKKADDSIQAGDFAQAKTLSSELDSLVSYYSGNVPTWPFDKNIILKFFSPQLVPVLGIIFNLDTLTQGNLSTIFGYLFPAK